MISRKLLRILAGFLLLAGQAQAKAPATAHGDGLAPALESLLAGA
jgi:hypothetical protein